MIKKNQRKEVKEKVMCDLGNPQTMPVLNK